MNISYSDFVKERDLQLTVMQEEYISVINKPKKKEFKREVYQEFFSNSNRKFITLGNKVAPHYNLLREIETEHNHDPSKTIADIFESRLTNIGSEITERITPDLITYEAMNLLFSYLREKGKKLYSSKKTYATKKEEPLSKSNLKWNANNETEMVQLIYALHQAGYIEGQITKIVSEFARLLNFPLGKNWKINHSASIHQRDNDYFPSIFENLKTKYLDYCVSQREKGNDKKK